MEEFGSIEEDYIDLNEKLNIIDQGNYKALKCEPAWFLSVNADHDAGQPIIKFKADYHYIKENFREAIDCYCKYMIEYQNTSLTIKRECLEGLSRSNLALKCYCHAQKYAYELKELCSTFDSYTVAYNLLFDCALSAGKYKDAVMYCIKLVTLHSLNSDFWLKLACTYGVLYKVPLLMLKLMKLNLFIAGKKLCSSTDNFVPCECHNMKIFNSKVYHGSENGIHLITMCLLHAESILKSVMPTASAFALKQNRDFQKGILKDIESFSLDLEYLKLLKEHVKYKHLGIKSKCETKEHSTEKYDEKITPQFTNKEHVHDVLEDLTVQDFEKEWLFLDHDEVTYNTLPK